MLSGYLINDIKNKCNDNDVFSEKVLKSLQERLKVQNVIVKLKALKMIKVLCLNNSGRTKIICQQIGIVKVIKQHTVFATSPDKLKGNYYNESIRLEAKNTLEALFSNQNVDNNKSKIMASRIKGYGNNIPATSSATLQKNESFNSTSGTKAKYDQTGYSTQPIGLRRMGGIGNPRFKDARNIKPGFMDRVKDRFDSLTEKPNENHSFSNVNYSANSLFRSQKDYSEQSIKERYTRNTEIPRVKGKVGGIWAESTEVERKPIILSSSEFFQDTHSENSSISKVLDTSSTTSLQYNSVIERKTVPKNFIDSLLFTSNIKAKLSTESVEQFKKKIKKYSLPLCLEYLCEVLKQNDMKVVLRSLTLIELILNESSESLVEQINKEKSNLLSLLKKYNPQSDNYNAHLIVTKLNAILKTTETNTKRTVEVEHKDCLLDFNSLKIQNDQKRPSKTKDLLDDVFSQLVEPVTDDKPVEVDDLFDFLS